MPLADVLGDLLAARPQGDVAAGVAEHLREGGAPRAGPEHGDPLDVGAHQAGSPGFADGGSSCRISPSRRVTSSIITLVTSRSFDALRVLPSR